ncbi:MAG: type II toxin-antitoxin system RelE/ParE family toxin [Planctomycetaceae bacterium]|nr:MAG: type II toxin-antitoxin system RelE/ParE family toxin [Planctomycetaceae bacterium]
MPYRLEIKESARKQIIRLAKPDQRRVMAAIADLAETPRPDGVRKIVGADNAYRIRVGDYRIVYEIHDRVLTVYIVRVGHRKDVYRNR